MPSLKNTAATLIGLFVDDGFMALGLVGWCMAAGLVLRQFQDMLHVHDASTILALGCVVILLVSVLRGGLRRH